MTFSDDAERPTPGERLSAVLAIASLAAAIVLVLLSVLASFWAVLLALAGLLGYACGGWYAVSRRGLIRWLGAIAALIGLAALVAGLVLAVKGWWQPVVIVLLAIVSVAAARHALRRTPRALRSKQRHQVRHPVTVTGRPVLIINRESGGGKAERFGLADECRSRGIEPVLLRSGDDLARLAEDAVLRGTPVIGMAGGDGSQAVVAAVAARHGVPHVCVPAGTRNHFALDLGLDRDDVVGALDAYSDAVERRIDLATVNGRAFVNNCSLGLYAKVVQSPQYREAKLRTAAGLVPEFLGPDAAPIDLRYAGPDGTEFSTAHLILVSNNPYQLAHPGGRGTRERLDSGSLGVVAVQVGNAAEASHFMLLELTGRVRRFAGWREWTAPEFEVRSGGPVEAGVDGEALRLDPPLIFAIQPGALRVWLPASAIAVSPAARAVRVLTMSTATDLVGVAAGHSPAG